MQPQDRSREAQGAREASAVADSSRSEQMLRPFFEDSALWPVLVVIALSLASFGAAILVAAIADRNYAAIAALLVLALISGDLLRVDLRRRRFGVVSGLMLSLWVLSALLAGAAVTLGLA